MKPATEKIISLLGLVKGKKPKVIIAIVVVFILLAVGVKYKVIPEELLNVDLIVDNVSLLFGSDSTQVVIDSLPK